jgi:hypothetical protein
MTPALHDTGTFRSENASRYLQQLCKHFAHKIEVRFDPASGEIALPPGPARLTADDTQLTVQIAAEDAAGLERARGIIDKHLVRFAFREGFEHMAWQGAAATPS